jgi:hypothetical protein
MFVTVLCMLHLIFTTTYDVFLPLLGGKDKFKYDIFDTF